MRFFGLGMVALLVASAFVRAEDGVWTPDPEIKKTLTKVAKVQGHTFSHDPRFEFRKELPDGKNKVSIWLRGPVKQEEATCVFSVAGGPDKELLEEAQKEPNANLIGFTEGQAKTMAIQELKLEAVEKGTINKIPFYRIRWTGKFQGNQAIRGACYLAVLKDEVVYLAPLAIGKDAEKGMKTLDAMAATFAPKQK